MQTNPGSGDGRALAALAVQKGPEAGSEIPLAAPVVTVGTGSRNDVVIADDSVSAVHARIEYANGGWRITDLGSTNGTVVEGVRLAPEVPTPLEYGATVKFGGVQTHFRAVVGANLDGARDSYRPPPPPRRVADRGGFRLPVWVVLLVLLLVVAAVFLIFGTPGPELAPEPDAGAETVGFLYVPPPPR